MPVDHYGKLIQASQSRKRFWLWFIFVALALIVICAGASLYAWQFKQSDVHADWPAILTMTATGNAETAPVRTMNDWQLVWQCELGKPLEIQVLDDQGNVIQDEVDGCGFGSTTGAVEMDEIGAIRLAVVSQGSWTVSIREPQRY